MFKIKSKLQAATLDIEAYKTALEVVAADIVARAAFEFIQVSIGIVPSWSGASRATFTELAMAVGTPVPISQAARAPNREREGRNASDGGIELNRTTGIFAFSYETDLPWLVYNESTNANQTPDSTLFSRLLTPGPYKFLDAASSVVVSVFGDFTPPSPLSFIRVFAVR